MSLQVIEGTWEEIERRKAELIGRQLRVIINPEEPPIYERDAQPNTSEEFHTLVAQWRHGVGPTSNTEQMAMHPAYQRIIGMGKDAIPLILTEMLTRTGHWFWALRNITGENPVPAEHAGNLRAMTDDWIRWGKQHRYI